MPFRLSDRRALVLASALGAIALPCGAQTPPLRVALDYQVDPTLGDCPTPPELEATIGKQLGYDPFVEGNSQSLHHLKASIQRTPSGTEAHVEWLDEHGGSEGERRLSSEGSECAEVARGLSFAIAVQIQLRASAEAPPAHAPSPVPPPPAPPPRPPRKESRRVVMVGAGVFASHGLTPEIAPGLRVFGSLGNDRMSVEVSTEATLATEFGTPTPPSPLTPQTSFSARELSAKLTPCLRHSVFGFCAVGMVGQLHVRGEGVDRVESPSALIAGGGARLQLVWPVLSSVGFLVQAEALVLATPRTVMLNRVDVWSTAPIALGASLDLAAIFR